MAVDQRGRPVDHISYLDTSRGLITPSWVAWERVSDAESTAECLLKPMLWLIELWNIIY